MTLAPRLVVLTEVAGRSADLVLKRVGRAAELARPGALLMVLRDYSLTARARLELGHELARIRARTGQALGVADRVDLAWLLRADAVHLGESSLAARDVRSLLPGVWLSRAHHGGEAPDDVDALLVAPVFAPRHGRAALGVEALAELRRRVGASLMLHALGGVTEHSAREALVHGADGVAVIGRVLDGDDPTALLEALAILR